MKIAEIFESISGEPGGFPTGSICTFIRLQGCNCKCNYCDSPETQGLKEGIELTPSEVFNKIKQLNNQKILITGGEPLIQQNELIALINTLWQNGFDIQIETNGTIEPDIKMFDYEINWIIDYKLGLNNFLISCSDGFLNKDAYNENFYLKFIINNEKDINTALSIIANNNNRWEDISFIFSPMNNILTPANNNPDLVKKIVDKIKDSPISYKSIIGHQLHKYYGLK